MKQKATLCGGSRWEVLSLGGVWGRRGVCFGLRLQTEIEIPPHDQPVVFHSGKCFSLLSDRSFWLLSSCTYFTFSKK